MKRQNGPVTRDGFTLVELLVVIAIIGILAGLTATAVSVAYKIIQGRAIAMEVATIEQAVEAYKTKYGSYPPDGSSTAAFEAHFRSAFPNIAPSEFTSLYSTTPILVANSNAPSGVMDPAEALVFCLGGFSKSPTNPFTGPGGPLAAISGGGFQYNVDRNEPFFEFPKEYLSLDTSSGATVSTDETSIGVLNAAGSPIGANDVLPVYKPKGRAAPLTYFASSTYRVDSSTGNYFNRYASSLGVARPYKSDQVNTKIALTTTTPVPQRDRYYSYMNDKSFQIVSAGLDDSFGGSPTVFFRFPSGTPLNIALAPSAQPAGSNYAEASGATAGQITQSDNVTNFSEGSLSDSLP